MKIGLLVDFLDSKLTGIDYYILGIVENFYKYNYLFRNQGIKIIFILNQFSREILFKIYPELLTYNEIFYIKSIKLPLGKITIYSQILPILTKKLDLNYIFFFRNVPFFLNFKQKIIFTVHDLSVEKFPHYHPFNLVILNKFLMKSTLKKSSLIITPSEFTKKEIMSFYRIEKNKLLKLFLPPKEFLNELDKKTSLINQNIKSNGKGFFLSISTIEPRKNIQELVHLFSDFQKKFKDIKLLIIGKIGWKSHKIINKIMNTKGIVYMGYVDNLRKVQLIKQSFGLIYLSKYEGYGLPVLESLWYGKPVIASNIESIRELDPESSMIKFINLNLNADGRQRKFNEYLSEIVERKNYNNNFFYKNKNFVRQRYSSSRLKDSITEFIKKIKYVDKKGCY